MWMFFLIFIGSALACSTAKMAECAAAATACGGICVCDFPVCECCIGCVACITATLAGCCECLYPSWSGCYSAVVLSMGNATRHQLRSSFNQTNIIKNNITKLKTTTLHQSPPEQQYCYWNGQRFSCGAFYNNEVCCRGKWSICKRIDGNCCPYCN